MSKSSRYSPEFRGRAVRMLQEQQDHHASQWAAIVAISSKVGCTPETLRKWVRQAEDDQGKREGLSSSDQERLKELEREYLELHQANEILRKASAFFAQASSDSMSLEATRHLWIARVDPRRRRHAVGMYTHVLDQWGIAYDQPIMLNRRQAGAAIEGAIRQAAPGLERVAVDTHGYTDFGMALAKPLGFDLCPRLAHLSDRKLYVPRGFAVPEILKPIVKQTVSLAARQGERSEGA